MKFRKETFTALVCTAVIEILLLAIVPVWIYRHMGRNSRTTVSIDWEAAYPFEKVGTLNGNDNKTLLDQYYNTVRAIEEKLEGVTNNNTLLRYPLSEFYCGILNTMGICRMPSVDNPVMVLENRYLSYSHDLIDNAAVAEKVQAFQESLNARGTDFLYVMAPYKCCDTDENNLYHGYIDYTRENAQTLAAELQERDVNLLNLQEIAIGQGLDVHSLFFRTDHHWKPSSALWGAGEVAAELNRNYGFDIDLSLYDSGLFSVQNYPGFFLGSQGKKVTLAYADPDDFEVVTPAYATEYHIVVPQFDLDFNGTFEETMIDQMQLTERSYPDNYYTANVYAAYGYGDQPLIAIDNLNIDNHRKVMVIKDSFADTLAPFLSLGLSDMMIIDLRHFTGSLQSCIDDYDPDLVIYVISGGTQHDIYKDFDEHKNMYDFR